MNCDRKKILLAVDGSNQSLEAVRYTSKVFPSQEIEVTLFHLLSKIPEFFYDLGKEEQYRQTIEDIPGWENALRASLNDFMSEARQILLDADIPEKGITIKIRDRKEGIARDIILESNHGYRAVVVGRRGLSNFKEFVLGSVANKLIEKLAHVTICVVGGKPKPGKILLAMDESENARRAVDYVATMLDVSAFEVTLFHVVRGFEILETGYENLLSQKYDRKWLESYETEFVFEEARNRLLNAGFDQTRVNTKLIEGVSSRAGAIVQEAREGRYGTIVVGRRGLSSVKEFFMGRVSNKVIQLARNHAVWVVS